MKMMDKLLFYLKLRHNAREHMYQNLLIISRFKAEIEFSDII